MYKINILSSEDFDDLPVSATRNSDISDSLGFANPYTKTAYVRRTSWDELNRYLIDHELEHLIEKHKSHIDENGICHKKGLKFFKDIIAPFSYNPGNIFGGSKGPFASFSQAALPALASVINPGLGLGIGAGQKILGGLNAPKASYQGPSGGINNLFPTGISQTSQQSFGQGFGQQGSFSPSGQGYGGGGGMGLFQPGVGQAGITMGAQGGMDKVQNQNQSGYFFPMRF